MSRTTDSRDDIVDFYNNFIIHPTCDWKRAPRSKVLFRVPKKIEASRKDKTCAVVATKPDGPEKVCKEIARLARDIVDKKRVEDPNQIAFLFPSLKSTQVNRMRKALEKVGLKVYAPRANRFLEVNEARAMFGLFQHVFGKPEPSEGYGGQDYENYFEWIKESYAFSRSLMKKDQRLAWFVIQSKREIKQVEKDYEALLQTVEMNRWSKDDAYDPVMMKEKLMHTPGISGITKKSLDSRSFERVVLRPRQPGFKRISLAYTLNRATSLDWTVLDLFYRLCGFDYFRKMFDAAEQGDEASLWNLSLISQYLDRYMENYRSIITGDALKDGLIELTLFRSYLYALFRRGESE